MALPSARRPKEVEEELKEEMKVAQREKFKVLTSSEIFLRAMTKWFEDLAEKKKRKVTPLLLKRKAVSVCFVKKIIYDRLPVDWVQQLKNRCKGKLRLYVKKKKSETEKKPEVKVKYESRSARLSKGRMKTEGEDVPDGTWGGDGVFKMETPILVKAESDAVTPNEVDFYLRNGAFTYPTPTTSKSETRPAQQVKKSKIKKFIDLSADPAPPRWISAYAKGILLPRVLTIYSTEDSNILFYDYNPKLKDSSGKVLKMAPQPRHGYDAFTIGED